MTSVPEGALNAPIPDAERLQPPERPGPTRDWLHQDDQRVRSAWFKTRSGTLIGRVWFGPHCEGPPGHAHGGAQASVLDLAMGGLAWARGYPVLAAGFEVRFRRSAPLCTLLRCEAEILRIAGRRLTLTARLLDPSGGIYSQTKGTFVVIPDERLQAMKDTQSELARGMVWVGDSPA